MSDSLNDLFRRNPSNFLQTHTLMVSPDGHGVGQKIPSPVAEIDLKKLNGPTNPPSVMMHDALKVNGGKDASISAYYLPAIVDNTSVMKIGVGKAFFFTADLSGCMFAAYGPDDQNLTVEHVNVRSANALVPIAGRVAAIAGAGHAFCKILSPHPSPDPSVTSYTTGGNVIGVLDPQGGWTFHYRTDQNQAAIL